MDASRNSHSQKHPAKAYKPLTEDVTELPVDKLDLRSDDDILAELKQFRPVGKERNLWAFWDKGVTEMYPWLQRNLIGWVRRLGTRWDVRCVDAVPGSPNNISNYVEKQYLVDSLVEGTMDGPFARVHASDIARLGLMYQHGGVWLDVASMILCDLDEAFWNLLSGPCSQYEALLFHLPAKHCAGGAFTSCMAAKAGNPLFKRWIIVHNELWKGRTNTIGLRTHPLIRHLDPLSPLSKQDVGLGPVDAEVPVELMDYFIINFAYERVRLLRDVSDGWDGLKYLENHVLFVEAIDELWKSNILVPAEQHFELLSLPFKPEDSQDPQQVKVRDWIEELISNCFAAKFSSSYWQPGMPVPLPKKWQEADNINADIAPGTWAEYLRYASEHFNQHRLAKAALPFTEYVEGEFGTVFEGRLLEPIDV